MCESERGKDFVPRLFQIGVSGIKPHPAQYASLDLRPQWRKLGTMCGVVLRRF